MIQNVGIIGSGKMGTDIFNYLSDFEYNLTWFILFEDEKEKLQRSFQKRITRQLKHELINQDQYNHKMSFVLTNNLSDLSSCDLIIESIVEEESLKKELFKELEKYVNPNCIFTSNSSSIFPSKLSNTIPVCGMHFFYPVAFKNIVELLIPDNSENNSTEILEQFLASINKISFNQNEKQAFLLNRFLLDIQVKAFELTKTHNLEFIQIDEISKTIIPDFGLFEMMDHVGHQTMYNSVLNYSDMDKDKERFQNLLFEIKIRMNELRPFIDNTEVDNLSTDNSKKIKNKLLSEIDIIYRNYITEFNIEPEFFKAALSDFCGLII
jgi:3-hydroxyacyl-CoA dehydrogenase